MIKKNVMDKTIIFKLIGKDSQRSFYKSSQILTKGYARSFDTYTEYDYTEAIYSIRKEHRHLVLKDGFDIICISNAISHMERLAFAGIDLKDGNYSRTRMQIEGLHTISIYGGDISACWKDEKYLRLIARHNGYSQNNVIISNGV